MLVTRYRTVPPVHILVLTSTVHVSGFCIITHYCTLVYIILYAAPRGARRRGEADSDAVTARGNVPNHEVRG